MYHYEYNGKRVGRVFDIMIEENNEMKRIVIINPTDEQLEAYDCVRVEDEDN